MKDILSILLRGGLGLVVEGAELYVGRAVATRLKQRMEGLLAFYFALAVLALAASIFLYILLYQWLSSRYDGHAAAAILLSVNLFLIGLLVLIRVLSPRRPGSGTGSRAGDILETLAGGGEPDDPELKAAFALGRRIASRVRKSAPDIAVGAALLGLAIGLRPELLDLLRGRTRPEKPDP